MDAVGMFQSAPVITDGRACEAYYEAIRYKTFQSAPVITDGRAIPRAS